MVGGSAGSESNSVLPAFTRQLALFEPVTVPEAGRRRTSIALVNLPEMEMPISSDNQCTCATEETAATVKAVCNSEERQKPVMVKCPVGKSRYWSTVAR
jgi:hypothetical protein